MFFRSTFEYPLPLLYATNTPIGESIRLAMEGVESRRRISSAKSKIGGMKGWGLNGQVYQQGRQYRN